jgi:hypothetical protein
VLPLPQERRKDAHLTASIGAAVGGLDHRLAPRQPDGDRALIPGGGALARSASLRGRTPCAKDRVVWVRDFARVAVTGAAVAQW